MGYASFFAALALGLFLFFFVLPRRGLQLLLFSLPFSVALNPAAGIDLLFLRLAAPIFALAVFLRFPREALAGLKKPQALLWFFFIALAALSLLSADVPQEGARKTIYLLSLSPLILAFPVLLKNQEPRMWISPLLFGGVLASIAGIAQFLAQFFMDTGRLFSFFVSLQPYLAGESFGTLIANHPSWFVNVGGRDFLRAFAFFPDPHILAFYLATLSSLALAFLLAAKTKRGFAGYVVCYSLFVICLALTFSRGGYLGWVVGTTAVLFVCRKSQLKSVYAFGALLASFVLMGVVMTAPIRDRFFSSFDVVEGSNAGRLAMWRDAALRAVEQPFGVGLGNYATAFDPRSSGRSAISAHNLYLDVGVETGVLGAAVFMGFLVFAASHLAARRSDPAALGFLGGVVWFSVHAFFENPLWSPAVFILFLLAASYAGQGQALIPWPPLSRPRSG